MCESCAFSSSGIADRWALYSGKISIRNAGFPLSHTTPIPTSSSVSRSFNNMLVNP